MNYLREIPKFFGLHADEIFYVCENPDLEFRFNVDGFLFNRPLEGTDWHKCDSQFLEELLVGLRHIVGVPWSPEYGDVYYVPDIYWGKPRCRSMRWLNTNEDSDFYKAGLVCSTEALALYTAEKMLEAVKR